MFGRSLSVPVFHLFILQGAVWLKNSLDCMFYGGYSRLPISPFNQKKAHLGSLVERALRAEDGAGINQTVTRGWNCDVYIYLYGAGNE